jgi:hypothetical protein
VWGRGSAGAAWSGKGGPGGRCRDPRPRAAAGVGAGTAWVGTATRVRPLREGAPGQRRLGAEWLFAMGRFMGDQPGVDAHGVHRRGEAVVADARGRGTAPSDAGEGRVHRGRGARPPQPCGHRRGGMGTPTVFGVHAAEFARARAPGDVGAVPTAIDQPAPPAWPYLPRSLSRPAKGLLKGRLGCGGGAAGPRGPLPQLPGRSLWLLRPARPGEQRHVQALGYRRAHAQDCVVEVSPRVAVHFHHSHRALNDGPVRPLLQ